jgi:hypothetical protein
MMVPAYVEVDTGRTSIVYLFNAVPGLAFQLPS